MIGGAGPETRSLCRTSMSVDMKTICRPADQLVDLSNSTRASFRPHRTGLMHPRPSSSNLAFSNISCPNGPSAKFSCPISVIDLHDRSRPRVKILTKKYMLFTAYFMTSFQSTWYFQRTSWPRFDSEKQPYIWVPSNHRIFIYSYFTGMFVPQLDCLRDRHPEW